MRSRLGKAVMVRGKESGSDRATFRILLLQRSANARHEKKRIGASARWAESRKNRFDRFRKRPEAVRNATPVSGALGRLFALESREHHDHDEKKRMGASFDGRGSLVGRRVLGEAPCLGCVEARSAAGRDQRSVNRRSCAAARPIGPGPGRHFQGRCSRDRGRRESADRTRQGSRATAVAPAQ